MDPVAETVGRPTLGRGQSPTAQLTAHPSDYIWTLSGPCRPAPALPASQEQGQALGGAQELPAHPWPNALLTAEPGAEGEGQDSFRETQSQPLLPTGPERRPGAKYASIFPGDEEQPLLKGAPARAGSGLLVGAGGGCNARGPQAKPILHRGPGLGRSPPASQHRIWKLLSSIPRCRAGQAQRGGRHPPRLTALGWT